MNMNLSHEDAVMLWNDVVEMAHDCNIPSMLPWLERLTPVSLENSVMTVSTRQNWTVRKIVGEYQPTIEQLLQDITLEPITLQIMVASAVGEGAGTSLQMPGASTNAAVSSSAPAGPSNGEEMFHVKHPESGEEDRESPAFADQADTVELSDTPSRLSPAAMAGAAVAAGHTGLFSGRNPYHAKTPAHPDRAQTPTTAVPGTPSNLSVATGQKTAPLTPQTAPSTSVPSSEPAALPHNDATDSAGEPQQLAVPETVEQEAVVPILEDGAVPKAAVNSGFSDFNFDTFIKGDSNIIAFSMARAVAEQPTSPTNPNPLFIWGPSGNGKTHLLLSIANYLHDHQPGMNVQYVPSNAFVEQYVDEINNKRYRGNKVLEAYRTVDVLLVDDVQFFEAKQSSVTAFFDIFNQLISDGKQIVLAADTPPDYLNLDDRMRTRFGSGVVIDVKAPTYEMKRAILLSYYERCRARMDWCDVEIPTKLFDIITELAPNNPRSMQGLIMSILIKANNDPKVLSSEGIKATIGELFKSTKAVSIDGIIRKVCATYDVRAEDIKGKSRTKNISEARQVVMWMARQLTDESYESIGAELGGRDHSTVYYGISTIEKRTINDRGFLYKLERLKQEILE